MLLDQIIEMLSDDKSNLSEALLKTKILLHQIGRKELVPWVNSELTGYHDTASIPPYRILVSFVYADVSNRSYLRMGVPIPLGHLNPTQRKWLETTPMRQSLAGLESLAVGAEQIRRAIPMDRNDYLSLGLGNGYRIDNAWCLVNGFDIQGIFAAIRTRLLDFLLELKSTIGDSATDTNVYEIAKNLDTAGMFNNAIFGPNTTIIVGNNNTQAVTNIVNKGDFDSLSRALRAAGVPVADIDGLKHAIEEEDSIGKKASLKGKIGEWLGGLMTRAAQGALDVSVEKLSTSVIQALKAYLGLSPD